MLTDDVGESQRCHPCVVERSQLVPAGKSKGCLYFSPDFKFVMKLAKFSTVAIFIVLSLFILFKFHHSLTLFFLKTRVRLGCFVTPSPPLLLSVCARDGAQGLAPASPPS